MKLQRLAGVMALAGMMVLAGLVGGVAVHSAFASGPVAQTGQAVQAAQAAATPAPGTTAPANPAPGKPGMPPGSFRGGPGGNFGGRGFGGPGAGGPGFGGPGFGPGGRQGSGDNASRVISATTSLITSVKADLTYATGKMDTTTVQSWLTQADGYLKTAQGAGSTEVGKAVATANAASDLARAADQLMAQALGADKLPSYSQRGFRGHEGPGAGASTTITQAQASRELAGLYNEILMKQAVLKNTSNAGDANTYLTAAQDQYKTAYTAYQAGKYPDAANAAAVSRTLLQVADDLLRAATAPGTQDTPVQVPAPNF